MQPRFCTKCGAPLQPQNKFCKACGAPVAVQSPPETPAFHTPTAEDMGQSLQNAAVSVPESPQAKQRNYEYVSSAAETPVAKTRPNYRRGAGTIILAILVCILFFTLSLATIILADTQISLSEQKIDNTLGSVLNTAELMDIPAYYFFPDLTDRSQTIVEWSLKEIETNSHSSLSITTEMAEEFLDDSTLLPFVIDKFGAYIGDIRDNTSRSGVSAAEIEDLVEDNEELLHELSGDKYVFDSNSIAELLEEQEWLEYLDAETLKDEVPVVFNSINLGLSYWALGVFCLLNFLLLVVLFLCNRWNFWHTCGDAGTVLIIEGSVLLIATAISLWLPHIWVLACGNINLLASLTRAVLTNCLMFHAILLGTGILLCVMKLIWKKVCQHKAKC